MQKVITIGLLATTVAFGGLYFSKSPEIQQIEVENPADETLRTQLKSVQSDLKLMAQENEKLKNQLKLFESVNADQKKVIMTDPQTGEKKVELASTPASPIMKLFQDPKMQEMMKERRNRMVEGRYGILFNKLNLTEEQKSKLIEVLGERGAAAMAMGMKMRMLESDEEKQAAREERELAEQEADAKVADILGDQYETYTDFNTKQSEYRDVEDLNRRLGEAKLSEAQTDQLASIMNETKSSFQFTNEKVNENPYAVYSLSDDEKAEYVKELEVRDELVLKESANLLSADQLEALKSEQARDRERATRSRRGRGGDRGGFGRGR